LDNTWIEGHALDATAYARADLPLFVRGPSGSLDTTFATGGQFVDVFGVPASPFDVFVSNDDRIFVVGSPIIGVGNSGTRVRQLDPEGLLDTTYGNNGAVSFQKLLNPVELLPSGGIVIGSAGQYIVIPANGATDGSFTPINPPSGITVVSIPAMTSASDGGAFMVFSATNAVGANMIGITKLTNTGEADTAFGKQGVMTAGLLSGMDSFTSTEIAVRPDGRIAIIGTYGNSATGESGYAILQLTAKGAYDTFFGKAGTPGRALFPNPAASLITPRDLQLVPNGRLISTLKDSASNELYSITSFTVLGDIDTTFGVHGTLSVNSPWFPDISLDDQNRLLVTSATWSLVSVSRFTTVGVLDTSFGTNGTATIPLPIGFSLYPAICTARVQKDGRIIIASGATPGTATLQRVIVLSRIWN